MNFCENYYIFNPFLILLTICSFYRSSESRPECRSVNDQPGICISIKKCPIFEKIFSAPLDLDQVRSLQKLTCGFDKNDPRVCCPSQDFAMDYQTFVEIESHPKIKLLPKLNKCGKVIQANENSSNVIRDSLGDRIIGGDITPHGSQPWLARLGYNVHSESLGFYCGASLISKNYVLTAAHCVTGDDENLPFMVRLGEYDFDQDPDCSLETGKCSYIMDVGIEKIIQHHNYNPETKQNDIALIRLSRDVSLDSEFIQPICLPFYKDLLANFSKLGLTEDSREVIGVVSGFGTTKWDVLGESPILRYVKLPIVSNEKCQSIYDGRTVITRTQMCAGGEADKDSCDGDSGGPYTIYSEENKVFVQAGIVSFGPTRCGSGGLPGIYTRLASQHLLWILDHIDPS